MSCVTGAAVLNSVGRNGNKSVSDLKEKMQSKTKGIAPLSCFMSIAQIIEPVMQVWL